ncbi:phage portal protein [Isoptericola dokdonensis]|uniref:Phage portal protein n=1 Tax=Isoptericola dokdonensis DS-3 TaxID=1300344 RepID=A0A161I7A8_9MICO|nr:phage portal protein [Isoptericola dokdonensis]ANC31438.1 Phage portal protein [Isoptericola dokdonensis DS-3]
MAGYLTGDSLTFGTGPVSHTSWGIPVVDAGTPLALGFEGRDPQRVWETQPSVRKVVEFAARAVAAVAWHAFERVDDTDRQRDAGSTIETTLNRPARFTSGFELKRDIVTDWMLYDRWCVALIGDELVRIPPRLLEVGSDFLGRVNRLAVSTPTGIVNLLDVPVAYGAGWHTSMAYGTSPTKTLSSLMDEQERAVQWRSDQWDHAAKLTGVIEHPGKFKDPRARAEFAAGFDEYRRSKSGGTPIFENGMKYSSVETLKPADAKDIEGRQLTDIEVSSFYHIPPELVGAREGTMANVAAFRQMLYGPTLGPILTALNQAFNSEIVPALAGKVGMYAELDREGAIAGSFVEEAVVLQTAVGGPWLTRAEARARKNLPHLDGTDELITPLNVTEGGLASPRDTAPPSAGEGSTGD